MTLDLNLESTACGRAQAAIGGDHRRALSRPFTGHRRPAASVSIISGCVRTPVHIVVEDHHDALGQRDRFQLLDSFGGRTLRVEQGWDDRVTQSVQVACDLQHQESWLCAASGTKINSFDPLLTALSTAYPAEPFLPFSHHQSSCRALASFQHRGSWGIRRIQLELD